METMTVLREQPEIKELFQVLEENGLTKERQQVEAFVSCLDNMESQFGQVLAELKEVREQLEGLQDKGIRSAALNVLEGAEQKAQFISGKFALGKQNFTRRAKNVVETFKAKGVDALKKAVADLKIPNSLAYLGRRFHSCMEGMNQSAKKLESISEELYKAAEHGKNAGRILIGRDAEEPAEQNEDKGILAKVQKAFLSCGRLLSSMEKSVEQAQKRAEHFSRSETGKPSVKAELREIKSEKSGKRQTQPVMQEITR